MPSRKKPGAAKKKAAAKKIPAKEMQKKLPGKRSAFWALAVIIFAAALLGLYLYSQQQIASLVTVPDKHPAEVTALELELANARQRLDQLGRTVAGMQRQPQEDSALRQQMEYYKKRLDALEKSQAESRLNNENHYAQNYLSALVVTVFTIQQNVQAGLPFEQQVKAAELIAKQYYPKPQNALLYDALFALQAAAGMGVKTYEQLQEAFDVAAMQVMRLHHQAQESRGGWGKIKALLARFVTVRSLSPSGDGVEAVLARAEIALRQKNIAQAVKQLSALPPLQKKGAEGWLRSAESYVSVQHSLRQLQDFLNNALAKQVARPEKPAMLPPPEAKE